MKILLLGKNGQVGWELQRSLAPLGTVVALDRRSTEYCGDLSQLENLAETVRAVRPDVIVNAAAHTAVDLAEEERDLSRTLNALAPGVLAQEAAKLGAWLVHYSTDYVFDGSGNRAWSESDSPAPLNVYGQTKLEGEQLIQAAGAQHLFERRSATGVEPDLGGAFGGQHRLRIGQRHHRRARRLGQRGAGQQAGGQPGAEPAPKPAAEQASD